MNQRHPSRLGTGLCFALALCATLAALALSLLRDPHPDTPAQWQSVREQEVLAAVCWLVALLLWGVGIVWSIVRTPPEQAAHLLPRPAQVVIGLLPLLLLGLILADLFAARWRAVSAPRGAASERRAPGSPSRSLPATPR